MKWNQTPAVEVVFRLSVSWARLMSIQRGNLYSKMLILRYGISVYGFTQILDNQTHSNIPALESFYFTSSVD